MCSTPSCIFHHSSYCKKLTEQVAQYKCVLIGHESHWLTRAVLITFNSNYFSMNTYYTVFKNRLKKTQKLTYFEKIYPVVACSQTGTSGGHEAQDPVGMPELQGLPDSRAWTAPSSGQTKYTQVKRSCFKAVNVTSFSLKTDILCRQAEKRYMQLNVKIWNMCGYLFISKPSVPFLLLFTPKTGAI